MVNPSPARQQWEAWAADLLANVQLHDHLYGSAAPSGDAWGDLTANEHRWLWARHRMGDFLEAVLDATRPPDPREPARLAFDDDTFTVTLDGTPHRVDNPKTYAVYKAIVTRETATITKAAIRGKVTGVKGQKTIPGLIEGLPRALRKTVRRSTKGYWHELPKIPDTHPIPTR
jgi:hypothetical protein